MSELINKIIANDANLQVLNFLKIDLSKKNKLISFEEFKEDISWETDDAFFKMNIPGKFKFIFANHSMFVNPVSGEIIAFRFHRSDIAFRINFTMIFFNKTLRNLKRNFKKAKQKKNYNKLGLNYFSNVAGDDVIDIRSLGEGWAIGIYFLDNSEDKIISYIN